VALPLYTCNKQSAPFGTGGGYLGGEMDPRVFDFKGVFCFSFDPAKEKETE